MEFDTVLRRRRMCRSFAAEAVPAVLLERVVAAALRAPSAGFTQGWAVVVLEGPDQTRRFWERTSEPGWRAVPTWPGLLRAPVILLPMADKQAYLERYSEPDKAALGKQDESAWSVPYWLVDTAFATMLMLLAAVDCGLGALFLGLPRGEAGLLADLAVPAGYQPIGAVALGWPDGEDRPSPSLARGRRPVEAMIHRGAW
jgi:nitroreductase